MTDVLIDTVDPDEVDQEALPGFFELSRLMVVALVAKSGGGFALKTRSQTEPNGPWAADWSPVGDGTYANLLAAGQTIDGRIAILVQTESNPTVDLIVEAHPEPSGTRTWDPPVNLGMPPAAGSLSSLAMGIDAGGRLEVFVVTPAGEVWWKYRNPDRVVEKTITYEGRQITVWEKEPPAEPWSDWLPLAGQVIAQLTVANNADDRIILFGTDEKGNVYRNEQAKPQSLKPDDWSGWVAMTDHRITDLRGPVAIMDRNDALNLFAVGNWGHTVHCKQNPPASATWGAWSRPGIIGTPVLALAAGIDGDGLIALAGLDKNLGIYANTQVSAEFAQWRGWECIAHAEQDGNLALNYNADGRLTLFLRMATQGGLMCLSQIALNSTEWDAGWTVLAESGVGSFVMVRNLAVPADGA